MYTDDRPILLVLITMDCDPVNFLVIKSYILNIFFTEAYSKGCPFFVLATPQILTNNACTVHPPPHLYAVHAQPPL